jgi:hypothetical protein
MIHVGIPKRAISAMDERGIQVPQVDAVVLGVGVTAMPQQYEQHPYYTAI